MRCWRNAVFEVQYEMGERQATYEHHVSKGHGYTAVMLPLACLCCGDKEYDEASIAGLFVWAHGWCEGIVQCG